MQESKQRFKVGQKVKLLVDYYGCEFKGPYKGDILEVKERCDSAGYWIDTKTVALSDISEKEFELVEEKVKRFSNGDKVISTKNTPQVPEGFVGYVAANDQANYEYAVSDVQGHVEYFNEDELELLSASKIQDIKGVVTNSDPVNSPKHYAVFDDIEAIEIIARSMTKEMFKGYCFGNLLKYRLRAGGKDDVHQELGKAEKYKELYEKYKELCQ